MSNRQDELEMNPITKGIIGFIATIITASTLGTWNTVNNTSIEIVRLQTKFTSLEEKISSSQNIHDDKIKELNSRLTLTETRLNSLEKQIK